MKKISISVLLLAFSLSLLAQPAGFQRLYYQYKGEDGVVALRIPGFLMRLGASIADLDGPERQLVRSLRSITVLTMEEQDQFRGVNFTRELNLSGQDGPYQMLLEIHDGNEDVVIAAREKRGKIRDLVVVVGGDENVLVHLRGRMDADLIGSLAGVTGMDELRFTAKI